VTRGSGHGIVPVYVPGTKGRIMLILTRRVGETIKIGEDVGVTVLGVKGNQVRLGIAAPRNVAVHREEIYERIKNERAAEHAPSSSASEEIA